MSVHPNQIVSRAQPAEGWGPCFGAEFTRVEHIEPVDDYELLSNAVDGVNSGPVCHVVRGPLGDMILRVSPYRVNFEPTQERFEWLVRNEFPRGIQCPTGALANLCNHSIDRAIASDRLRVAA